MRKMISVFNFGSDFPSSVEAKKIKQLTPDTKINNVLIGLIKPIRNFNTIEYDEAVWWRTCPGGIQTY